MATQDGENYFHTFILKQSASEVGIQTNIKNIAISGGAPVFKLFISIIRVKIVASLIGTLGIGLIGQLNNLINIATFMSSLGMEKGLVKEVAAANAKENSHLIHGFRITFLIISILVTTVLSILIFSFSETLSLWLLDDARYAFYVKIVAAFTMTLGLSIPYSTFMVANKLVKQIFFKSVLMSVLSTLATIALILAWKLDGAVISLVVSGLINTIVCIVFLRRNNIPLYLSLKEIRFYTRKLFAKTLFQYGSVLLMSSLIYQVVNILVKRIILENSGINEMGIYQAMSNITAQYLPVFMAGLSVYFLPQMSEQRSNAKLNQSTNDAIRSILLLALAPLILLSVLSKTAIWILYTTEFISGHEILRILIIFSIFNIVNKILQLHLISGKYLSMILLYDVFVAVLIVSGSYVLYPHFGIKAPAFALLITSVIHFTGILYYLRLKTGFLLDGRSFVLLVVLFMMLSIFAWVGDLALWVNICLSLLAITITYIITLSKKETEIILETIKKRLKK